MCSAVWGRVLRKWFGRRQAKELQIQEPSTGQIARKRSILEDAGTSFLFIKNGSLTPVDLIFITGYSCFFYSSVSETPIHNLLTVKETAEYLRIPVPTVYYLVQRGQLPAIHIGGRWRIKKSLLDRDILRPDKQGQPTVVVVDDDPDLQDLFKAFLKKSGFSRVVVGTAKDAIHSLRKQKFDLMFLDLQLPDGTGDEVYKTAKQIDPDLNVIVITGYPDSEMLDRILQISPVTVLKKPLKIEQLNQTVKILGHSTARVEPKEIAAQSSRDMNVEIIVPLEFQSLSRSENFPQLLCLKPL